LELGDGLGCFAKICLVLTLCYPEYNIEVFLGGGFQAKEDPPEVVGSVAEGELHHF
jgi:hypothetical protein